METEITIESRVVVAWRLVDGQPVVDGVRIVGCDLGEAARALADDLRTTGETVH